ncbi:MAG: DNA polymerase I [Thermodesulfobacteriota bacterium]|nr:DNA polymerase I [Thermodesulfobacteriota bacterium]
MSKHLYILDASSYVFRAYHAIGLLTNSKGFPTNAIFGFINMFNKFIMETKPEYFVAVFDSGGKSFRNEIYDDYKANRGEAPEDISLQFPKIIEYLKLRGICVMSQENFEADDIIGSLSKKYQAKNKITIISGDKDFTQLINKKTIMLDTMKNRVTDDKEVLSKYGLKPEQMIDYFSLVGDSIDNIPGVRGIGPKTAQSLIDKFKTLDNLYKNIKKIDKERIKNLLEENKELAYISKELVTINTNLEITDDFNQFKISSSNNQELNDFFKELEFDSMIDDDFKKSDLRDTKYSIINNKKDFIRLKKSLSRIKEFSLDLETTSINALDAEIVGIAISYNSDEGFYIPLSHETDIDQLDLNYVLENLKEILESSKIKKIGQNLKYEILVFKNYSINLGGIYFDTMVASHFLDSSLQSYSLDNLSRRFLDHKMLSYKDITKIEKKEIPFKQVPVDVAMNYACEDSDITYKLYCIFKDKLLDKDLLVQFHKNEMPFVSVLANLESNGVFIDSKKLNDISAKFEKKINKIEKTIYKSIGYEFNINSTLQLRDILFDKLKLKPFKKTKKGEFSTDSESLQSIEDQHSIVKEILAYRFYSKLKSTYLDSLPELINVNSNRVHTSYNQTGTSTGRLSSSNPNLQNIPIKTDEGKQIRESFSSPKDDSVIISADYSQIELRLLAHFSGDPTMLKSYKNNEDIHLNTASEIFEVPINKITSQQRSLAKTINFGIIYGIGPKRLSLQIDSDIKTAKEYIEKYFSRYSRVKNYFEDTISYTRENGYIETILNRKRYLKDINSKNFILRSANERAAINTPIQGSAADVIKLAMININQDKELKNYAKLVIQVHDELVFECKKDKVDYVSKKVKNYMENSIKIKVPLKVDINKGQSWSDAH